MGPSGSGKSTLLSVIGGLDRPDSGRVLFEGQPLGEVDNLDLFRARSIGFVFQSFYLLPTLSAIENVQIPMFESDRPLREREPYAEQLLNVVGLSHRKHHLPMKLSVGERQRVAIARALANDPPLLLADEPTGNLDSKTTDDVLDLFAQLHTERGMTLVMITHSDEVGSRAERLVRFRDGRVEDDSLIAR
jgi:putative ABC transport system ATP-binding protein